MGGGWRRRGRLVKKMQKTFSASHPSIHPSVHPSTLYLALPYRPRPLVCSSVLCPRSLGSWFPGSRAVPVPAPVPVIVIVIVVIYRLPHLPIQFYNHLPSIPTARTVAGAFLLPAVSPLAAGRVQAVAPQPKSVSPFPFPFLFFSFCVRLEERIKSYKVGYRYRIGTDYRSPLDIYLC